jgi:rhodanese-related sulfurtransferase
MDEHSSARAASILQKLGFSFASALLGGFNAWIKAGYPTEKK